MHALTSGFIGAAALTAMHESTRRFVDDPPRMDVLGMRAIERLSRAAGQEPPSPGRLYALTLAGDIVSNGVYYAAIGRSRGASTWIRAAALGTAAGVGALTLPKPLGLGHPPHSERIRTRVLTVALYLGGALVAAAAQSAASRRRAPAPNANGGRRFDVDAAAVRRSP